MHEHLQLSPDGEALIKHYESCKLHAYYCPAGKLTIGWGHTRDVGRNFRPDDVWTQEQADEAFREDMAHFGEGVKHLLKREATQGQYDALVSFAYNAGLGALKGSTILRKFNAGDNEGAARAFALWNKATVSGKKVVLNGLVRRRGSEAAMFLGDSVGSDEEDMPQSVDVPKAPKSAAQSKSIWTSITMGATGVFTVAAQAWDQVKPYITDPHIMIILTVVFVAGSAFLAADRIQKLTEDNV